MHFFHYSANKFPFYQDLTVQFPYLVKFNKLYLHLQYQLFFFFLNILSSSLEIKCKVLSQNAWVEILTPALQNVLPWSAT